MIRCRTPQLAPTVNASRIRRRLVARFSSKPCLEEIHSILSFCIRRMSISMGTWEALDGFPNQEHRSTSGDECIVRNTSNARMIHHTSPAGSTPAPRIRRRLDHTHAHTNPYIGGTVKTLSVEQLSRSRDPRAPAQETVLITRPLTFVTKTLIFTEHEGTLAKRGPISLGA